MRQESNHKGLLRGRRASFVLSAFVVLALALVAAIVLELHPAQSRAGNPAISPSPSATPSSTPIATSEWSTYTSSKWGYTVKYPANWYDLPNSGAPDTDKYFSNQNVMGPAQMDQSSVFLTIRVHQDSGFNCASGPTRPYSVTQQSASTVGGLPARRSIVESGPGNHDALWALVVSVSRPKGCYEFEFLSLNAQARDQNLAIDDALLSTVTFLR
jgi:hypothetical protein